MGTGIKLNHPGDVARMPIPVCGRYAACNLNLPKGALTQLSQQNIIRNPRTALEARLRSLMCQGEGHGRHPVLRRSGIHDSLSTAKFYQDISNSRSPLWRIRDGKKKWYCVEGGCVVSKRQKGGMLERGKQTATKGKKVASACKGRNRSRNSTATFENWKADVQAGMRGGSRGVNGVARSMADLFGG